MQKDVFFENVWKLIIPGDAYVAKIFGFTQSSIPLFIVARNSKSDLEETKLQTLSSLR